MSIPREPRQIMINLMYLVLTAMLALNVSAEIINAFFKLRDGIDRTNVLLDNANAQVIKSMEKSVAIKTDYKALVPAAKEVQTITKAFVDYIEDVKVRFTVEAGGEYGEIANLDAMPPIKSTRDATKWGKAVKAKNKEIPTRFFVDGYDGPSSLAEHIEPEAPNIKAKIIETRQKLEAVLLKLSGNGNLGIKQEELNKIIDQLTLEIDTTNLGRKSWEQFNFNQMPVAACFPILAKMQNDAKTSEASIINYLAGKIGVIDIPFDNFVVVASPKKTFLLKGGQYEADIFLSAASSQAKVDISVNGQTLKTQGGKATYSATASGLGEQSYTAKITVKNPFNGKVETYTKTFSYEVGTQSQASVSADKMNVFYMGVDNPITIAAGGDFSQINATCTGCDMTKKSGGKYNVRVTSPGVAKVTVSAPDVPAQTFEFRIKRIPDPVAMLGPRNKKTMGTGEIKAHRGIRAALENFDFSAVCKIAGFEIARVPKKADAIVRMQTGTRFDGTSQNIINSARPGDVFYFSNIKAKCPGDRVPRPVNDLVIKIR